MSTDNRRTGLARMVVETVVHLLNQQGTFPDEAVIITTMARKYKRGRAEAEETLKRAIADGTIVKVPLVNSQGVKQEVEGDPQSRASQSGFGGAVRPALGSAQTVEEDEALLHCGIPSSTAKRCMRVIRKVLAEKEGSQPGQSSPISVSAGEILAGLHAQRLLVTWDESDVENNLSKVSSVGCIARLPNGNYIPVPPRLPNTPKLENGDDSDIPNGVSYGWKVADHVVVSKDITSSRSKSSGKRAHPSSETGQSRSSSRSRSYNQTSSSAIQHESQTQSVRSTGRRKIIKKSLGQDFVEPTEVSFKGHGTRYEPRCDQCKKTGASDDKLLHCRKCETKIHPSCLGYSVDLAHRCHQIGWECMNCKICELCEDSTEADAMLCCDLCDKGFHMFCLEPPMGEKPDGKWVCKKCKINQENRRRRAAAAKSKQMTVSNASLVQPFVSAQPMVAKKRARPSSGSKPLLAPTFSFKVSSGQSAANKTIAHLARAASQESNASSKSSSKSSKTTISSVLTDDDDTNVQKFQWIAELRSLLPADLGPIHGWSSEEVEKIISLLGFQDAAKIFREQDIDGSSLLLMERDDLISGMSIKLGPAVKLYHRIRYMQQHAAIPAD